jgi:hypothetical protein
MFVKTALLFCYALFFRGLVKQPMMICICLQALTKPENFKTIWIGKGGDKCRAWF